MHSLHSCAGGLWHQLLCTPHCLIQPDLSKHLSIEYVHKLMTTHSHKHGFEPTLLSSDRLTQEVILLLPYRDTEMGTATATSSSQHQMKACLFLSRPLIMAGMTTPMKLLVTQSCLESWPKALQRNINLLSCSSPLASGSFLLIS